MKPSFVKRILIISEDRHLVLALQVLLSERGHLVRCQSEETGALRAIQEFRPDAMITASAFAVFVSVHNSELVDFPRPLDTRRLLDLLE